MCVSAEQPPPADMMLHRAQRDTAVSQICTQNTGGYVNTDNGHNNMNLGSSIVEMIEMFNINTKYACFSLRRVNSFLFQPLCCRFARVLGITVLLHDYLG